MKTTAARFLEELSELANLHDEHIAHMLGTEITRVQAWREGFAKPPPVTHLRLCDIREVVAELAKTRSPNSVYRWLFDFHPGLDAKPALEIAYRRIHRVEELIEKEAS